MTECKIMIQTRQILGGLMRLFQHQLNHTEFLTKTAQPKPTFWKSIILESNHPTCWMVTGSHYCGSLVKIFQRSLKIFEDLREDPSADLWGFLSKILKDLQWSCQDSQGSREDLQGSLKVVADICKILKDLGKILKVLIGKILRDFCAILADLCTIIIIIIIITIIY